MSTVVSDDGILLPAASRPFVVEIDGHYVWSLTPDRDGRRQGGGVLVPWPGVLRPYLSGRGRVRVTDAAGAEVLYDAEVGLGAGSGRLAVVDPAGHRLCVDKVGHLARSFADTAEAVRDEILAGTRRAVDDLREHAGVHAYLNYGALLGAVREGRMLDHDSDTDLCYLSAHSSPVDIIMESYRITRVLRARGWNVLRMSGGDVKLLLPLSDGRTCHVDVFAAFHVGGTFFQLGNRSGVLPRSAIEPFSVVRLHGHEFPAPRDPEAMLAFLYGPGWRTPDPSFRYADPPAGVRRLDGWLRGFRTDMGRWTAFHTGPRVAAVPRSPSDFARWVEPQLADLPADLPVADLGTGTGRDALWFARDGRAVRALDFSRASLHLVRRRARNRGVEVDVDQLVLGELRSTLLQGSRLAREPHHLHARHLVGCLDDAALDQLWLLARMALRPGGGRLFLELAASYDGPRGRAGVATGPEGLVRRVDPVAVRAAIERAGGVVERCTVGPGEDMFDLPDPAVCRIRAAWPAPRGAGKEA